MCTANTIVAIVPDPDSHFRLVACKHCGSDKVGYQLYEDNAVLRWRVQCPGCGYTVDKDCAARHDAQIAWNRRTSHE